MDKKQLEQMYTFLVDNGLMKSNTLEARLELGDSTYANIIKYRIEHIQLFNKYDFIIYTKETSSRFYNEPIEIKLAR